MSTRAVEATMTPSGPRLQVTTHDGELEAEVVVDVEVAGVTYPDLLLIRGEYQDKRSYPFVPGTEVVGIVRSAPDEPALAGRRVVALTPDGGWRERVGVPRAQVLPIPDGIAPNQATSLLTNYVTAYFALVTRGQARAGETVLIRGAAGGVGSAAVQVASALGLTTIALVSTPDKADYAKALGADHVLFAVDGWKDQVLATAGRHRVDLVVDPVGGDDFTDCVRVLGTGGRALILGFVGGSIPTVRANRLLMSNTSVVGVATGAYMALTPGALTAHWTGLCDLIGQHDIALPEARTFSFEEADIAVTLLAERRAIGRLALAP